MTPVMKRGLGGAARLGPAGGVVARDSREWPAGNALQIEHHLRIGQLQLHRQIGAVGRQLQHGHVRAGRVDLAELRIVGTHATGSRRWWRNG